MITICCEYYKGFPKSNGYIVSSKILRRHISRFYFAEYANKPYYWIWGSENPKIIEALPLDPQFGADFESMVDWTLLLWNKNNVLVIKFDIII